MQSKAEIFKYIALGAAGLYVYQKFQENPRFLGTYEETHQKADRFLNYALNNPRLNPKMKNFAKNLTKSYIDSKMNVRDVTPIGEGKNE